VIPVTHYSCDRIHSDPTSPRRPPRLILSRLQRGCGAVRRDAEFLGWQRWGWARWTGPKPPSQQVPGPRVGGDPGGGSGSARGGAGVGRRGGRAGGGGAAPFLDLSSHRAAARRLSRLYSLASVTTAILPAHRHEGGRGRGSSAKVGPTFDWRGGAPPLRRPSVLRAHRTKHACARRHRCAVKSHRHACQVL
jgi:hypothetical protein